MQKLFVPCKWQKTEKKMKKYKMLVSDIDGTILGSTNKLSSKIINTIKKASQKGLKIIIATGRMHKAAIDIHEELGLNTPIISYQGAIIRDNQKLYKCIPIEKQLAFEIINKLRKYNEHINVYTEDDLYVENVSDRLLNYTEVRNISYTKIDKFEDISDKDILKIITITKTPEKNNLIKTEMSKDYGELLNIVKSTDIYCEFVNKYADKSYALNYLANYYNIPTDEVIAVGDQENDILMIKAAGLGAAMGNGCEQIKKVADYICPSVEQDGVAQLIEEYML